MSETKTIAPIPTTYQGRRYRSRTEARWACFFETGGLKFEYESEGYDINGCWYLPDFWLPCFHPDGRNAFAEVKGKPFTPHEHSLCVGLTKLTGEDVVQLVGSPAMHYPDARCLQHYNIVSDWEDKQWKKKALEDMARHPGDEGMRSYYTARMDKWSGSSSWYGKNILNLMHAYRATLNMSFR